MFSWESLYSIKVGGVAPHVSELSEALAKGAMRFMSLPDVAILMSMTRPMEFITRGWTSIIQVASLNRWKV